MDTKIGSLTSGNLQIGDQAVIARGASDNYWVDILQDLINSGYYFQGGTDIAVTDGGTNISSYASGDMLYASDSSTLSKLPAGSSGQVLAMGSFYPQWVTSSAEITGLADPGSNGIVKRTSLNVTNIATAGTDYYNPGGTNIAVEDGGTNISSYSSGDILYATNATTLAKLARGTSGHLLTMGENYPNWAAGNYYAPGGTDIAVADGGTNISSYASGDILYASNSNTLSKLPAGSSGQVLSMGSFYPQWVTNAAEITGLADPGSNGIVKRTALNVTAIATAGTDYYNPGGTDVAVTDGGTNISSYSSGDLLYATNATTLAKLAAGSPGFFLKMGAAYPEWATGLSNTLAIDNLGSRTALLANYLYTGTITGRTFTLPSASNQDVITYRGIAALDTTVNWPSSSVLQIGASGYASSTFFPSGYNVEFALAYANPYWFLVDSSSPTGTYYQAGGTDVAVADGGTNLSSYTAGDVIYASATTTLAKLGIGTSGYVLTSNGTLPVWASGAGGAGIPGGSSGELQWNNNGSFAGVTASLVSGSTVYASGLQITGNCQLPALYGSDGTTRLNVGYTGYITGATTLATGITLLGSTTLTASGTYMLYGQAYLKYNGTTYASTQTGTIKLRRTNNTATDIANATTSPIFDIVTAKTGNIGTFPTNHVIYTSTTTGDIIGIYGNVSALPGAGSVQATEASVFALRLWE